MDIVTIAKGQCEFCYLDLGDNQSFNDFIGQLKQVDEKFADDFLVHLKGVVEVAGCPKKLGKNFYKKLNTPKKTNITLYELIKGRVRLFCYELEPNKRIIVLKSFYKKDKKEQDKEIKKLAKDTVPKLLKSIENHEVNWKEIIEDSSIEDGMEN